MSKDVGTGAALVSPPGSKVSTEVRWERPDPGAQDGCSPQEGIGLHVLWQVGQKSLCVASEWNKPFSKRTNPKENP